MCACDKSFVASVTQELMHRILWDFLCRVIDINWCLSTFDENHLTGGAVVELFADLNRSRLLEDETSEKFIYGKCVF